MERKLIRDIPSPIDLRDMTHAQEWAETAMVKRPYREEFFSQCSKAVLDSKVTNPRILELGSGPGFLAKHILDRVEDLTYVALDFSNAMHQLARFRIGHNERRVKYIERSFLEPDWTRGLGIFDIVVTNQAIHELRHKRYAVNLHKQVKSLLIPKGFYLACDHYSGEDGMADGELYMTKEEQRNALVEAGFQQVDALLFKSGMALYIAS